MSIFLGSGSSGNSGSFSSIWVSTAVGASLPVTNSVFTINATQFNNTASGWPSISGGVNLQGFPLSGTGSNGFWQFNGTDEYLVLSSSIVGANFKQGASAATQSWTVMFRGTFGDITSPNLPSGPYGRTIMGNYNYQTTPSGSDILIRNDSGEPAGKASIDVRTGGGTTRRFTIDYTSGSENNLAIVYNNYTTSLYQSGSLIAQTASASPVPLMYNNTGQAVLFGSNENDSAPYNGQLGNLYIWNRALSNIEIKSAYNLLATQSTAPASAPVTSVYTGANLVYGTPPPTQQINLRVLLVAGGGSGGCGTGGGGGAGGVVHSGSITFIPGTYPILIGSGGRATGSNNSASPAGNRGQDSSLVSGSIIVSASGGGGGVSYDQAFAAARNNGGSGGGCSANNFTPGLTIDSAQGRNGASSSLDNGCGHGGGGAAQTGLTGSGAYPNGNGGPGGSGSAYSIRSGTSVFYGGGGGGGNYVTSNNPGLGGPGGGSNGSKTATNPSSASANTGGGGGGTFRSAVGDNNGISGNGGSGICVIAYLTSSFSSSALNAISGGIITDYTSGSAVYRSHTFLSSSNLVIS
jgi:hypothetical protein